MTEGDQSPAMHPQWSEHQERSVRMRSQIERFIELCNCVLPFCGNMSSERKIGETF
jgi:hypothetical protein